MPAVDAISPACATRTREEEHPPRPPRQRSQGQCVQQYRKRTSKKMPQSVRGVISYTCLTRTTILAVVFVAQPMSDSRCSPQSGKLSGTVPEYTSIFALQYYLFVLHPEATEITAINRGRMDATVWIAVFWAEWFPNGGLSQPNK